MEVSTEQPELLPCPFCGASGAEVCNNTEKYIGFEWSVNCAVCDGNCGGHEDEATAVLAWNSRNQAAPISEQNRIVAYSAAAKLRELGYEWSDSSSTWITLAAAP